MATAKEKKAAEAAEADEAKKAADEAVGEQFGTSEVEDALVAAQKHGYIGLKADPLPNSAHSQESGPDAPPVHEQTAPNIDDLTKEG